MLFQVKNVTKTQLQTVVKTPHMIKVFPRLPVVSDYRRFGVCFSCYQAKGRIHPGEVTIP